MAMLGCWRFAVEILAPLNAEQTALSEYAVTLRAISSEDLEDVCAGWRKRAAEVGEEHGWRIDIRFVDDRGRKWGVGEQLAFARKWPVAAAGNWVSPRDAADFRMDDAPGALVG